MNKRNFIKSSIVGAIVMIAPVFTVGKNKSDNFDDIYSRYVINNAKFNDREVFYFRESRYTQNIINKIKKLLEKEYSTVSLAELDDSTSFLAINSNPKKHLYFIVKKYT